VVAAASDPGACVCEDDATVSELDDLRVRVAELEAERDRAKALDTMDDAIHVAAPWEPRKSLCGQLGRRNLAPLDGPSPDGWEGCWSCLDVAKWIHERSRVQAEQIAALQEALKRIAEIDPDEWHRSAGWKCVAFIQRIALAEGCAAPADEEEK